MSAIKSINEPNTPALPTMGIPSINEPRTPIDPPGEVGGGDLVPELLSIDPDIATIGDPDVTVTCIGEDFDETCVITFNGGDEATVFVSATELTTVVRPSLAGTAGEYPVTVKNANGESEPAMFEFVEPARSAHVKSRAKPPPKASKKLKGRR